jgi:hypothetical protein
LKRFPFLGCVPIKKPKELLAVIRKIEERGSLEVASRTLQVGQIFSIATGRAEPADLRGALQPRKAANYSFQEKSFVNF